MKKLIILTMAAVMACSCEKGTSDIADVSGETVGTTSEARKFTFTVKGDFMNPEFSDGTRAAGYMTADGVELTDLWVVDVVTIPGESSPVIKQMLHQTSADADWGSPKMSLTLGTHHVMFLASRGQGAAYADGVVTWSKPLDTFYLDYEVTVVKTSKGNRAVTLNRCATKLKMQVEDAIPSGTTSVTISPEYWYNGWDMIHGSPIMAEAYSVAFSISSSMWNRTGLSLTVWGLSPAEEWQTDVDVVAKAGDDNLVDITIPEAPFIVNRSTNYTGHLFSSASESSVSLLTEWLPDYEGVY